MVPLLDINIIEITIVTFHHLTLEGKMAGLDERGIEFLFSIGAGIQIGSEAHPASFPEGCRGIFPGNEATGA
jgi:hypothetical protein